jgi:hypothetical protein
MPFDNKNEFCISLRICRDKEKGNIVLAIKKLQVLKKFDNPEPDPKPVSERKQTYSQS